MTNTTPLMSIALQHGVPTTYLALSGALSLLVLLTLWREEATARTGMFFSRSFAALAFLTSRLLVVVFTGAILGSSTVPPVAYMFLNFVCLFLAIYSIQEASRRADGLLRSPRSADADAIADTAEPESNEEVSRAVLRSLRTRSVAWGAVGVLAYWVMPRPEGVGYSVVGVLDAVFLTATLGVSGAFVLSLRRVVPQVRFAIACMTVALVGSWLLIIGASYASGTLARVLLEGARVADVFTLIAVLFSLQASYQTIGFYHRTRADVTEEEAEKARAELNLLSRVASDIYEDSSSMIQRQQDYSRDLMRRIEGLERILQIGVKIQKNKNLKQLLHMVADLVCEELGFGTVILRILNERTQNFETKAVAGVDDELRGAVMAHRLPLAEFERMTDPRHRISRSYFVKATRRGDEAEGNVVVVDGWSGIERLIVPLVDDEDVTLGYISVEDPADTGQSVVATIENLETIAMLAVTAIRNATYYKDVGEKNEKLKLYAEKLSGLNKMKSNFVATISHEFRTPLTSIKAYCETLLKNADNVDRNILKEFLIVIDEESDRLMTLIEDILDFSQMESGAIKFERTPCNMKEIIAAGLKELEKNFHRKNITVERILPAEDVMVRAECELMKQLVVNLLHNASKFTPDNGRVWVRVDDESVSARITVEDSGIGIPDEEIDKIFDHFHQADSTSTREYGGSGLGLAICKNIVDWHDGKIWVENVPGRGARFVVVIPKKQAMVRNEVLSSHGTLRRYEVERYLELIVEMVAEMMNVKKASIMLVDPVEKELRIDCAIGLDEEIVEHARVKLGEGVAGRVASENRSYLVHDIEEDERVSLKNNDFLYDSRSFLSVPISSDGTVLGVINVANPTNKDRFEWADCRLLEVFAGRVAIALDKMHEFTQRYADFESVRGTLKSMLDAKRYIDDQSAGAMSLLLADVAGELRLSAEETATLQYAFNVYDLGLAKIGYNIVKQPRQMTSEDRNNIEQHTIVGVDMLRTIEKSPDVNDAVLYHHENYDGSGYPGRLSGDEIPLNARIIRVADAFRALVSHRPYQKQYTAAEAVEVLKHRAGTLFDPKVVEVFVNVVGKHVDRFDRIRPRMRGVAVVEADGFGVADESS